MSKIAFLGAGNIARAIMGGLIQSGTPASDIAAADPLEAAREGARQALGIAVFDNNRQAAEQAQTVLVCVKPATVAAALEEIREVAAGKLIISVAAGVTTQTIAAALAEGNGKQAQIVRCMPNTPALVKQGMTALFAPDNVDDAARTTAERIMQGVGETLWVNDESELDVVTAVSGSGPAYFLYLMEAMIEAAVEEGLSEDVARKLVLQTAIGSATIANDSEDEPATLRKNVTSPGGTTEAAITHLREAGFVEDVMAAVKAARVRSVELSKE